MLRISKVHTWLYQKTNGLVGARLAGLDMLLLSTVGCRSGIKRTTPMPYLVYENGYLLIASNASLETNPGWYFNLCQTPGIKIQIFSEIFEVQAAPIEGEQRDTAWQFVVSAQPRYAAYQRNRRRIIPVILLRKTPQRACQEAASRTN